MNAQTRLATLGVLAGILPASNGFGAASLLFDNLSPLFASSTSSTEGLYNTIDNPGSQFMAGLYQVPAGTSQITGFDFTVINDIGDTNTQNSSGGELYNSSAMTVSYIKITTYFWGAVNPGTINSSSPAFSNLLGTQTTAAEHVSLPTGYVEIFGTESATPTTPSLTFTSAINVPSGITTIGVTFNITESSTRTGTFVSQPLLTPGVTTGNPPTAGAQLNAFFENTSGETNGNFIENPYTFGLTDNAIGTRLWGTVSGSDNWNNSGGGAWETNTNWSLGSVPQSANDIAFNLSSPGYTVTINSIDACKDLYVQNDNVNISIANPLVSLSISGSLSVGNASTGVLALTNQNQNNAGSNVSAGSVTVGSNGGTGQLSVGSYINLVSTGNVSIGALSSLNLSGGSVAGGTPSGVLFAPKIVLAGTTGAWTGKIDIGTHALDLSAGVLATVTNQAAQGYNHGTWNAAGGITSTAAASDTMHLTAVGVISNNIATNQAWLGANAPTGAIYGANGSQGTFEGLNPGTNDVLVKYTYYGDCLLLGNVTGTDYSIVDNTFLHENVSNGVATTPISGWYNGDFNYDGAVNGSDYTLMDNAFNEQGGSLGPDITGPTSPSGGTAGISGFSSTLTTGHQDVLVPLVQYGSPTALVAGGSAVPEPTGLGLLAIGSAGLLARRSRRR